MHLNRKKRLGQEGDPYTYKTVSWEIITVKVKLCNIPGLNQLTTNFKIGSDNSAEPWSKPKLT